MNRLQKLANPSVLHLISPRIASIFIIGLLVISTRQEEMSVILSHSGGFFPSQSPIFLHSLHQSQHNHDLNMVRNY